MHNLTKIKIFRALLWLTYPIATVIILPFALIRRKKSSSLFFFLDRYAIGGAQRVYLDILESVSDIQKTVFFTRKSADSKLKDQFYQFSSTECRDIHFWCDNLFFRLFSVHYFAFYVNRHRSARVLSSNSTFFYDMLPFLDRSVVRIELLHNFSYGKKGMEFFGLANHKYLDLRMVIDEFTKQNIISQYREFGIDHKYDERVIVSEYGVDIPTAVTKTEIPPLKILYAGRGTHQKRVWLLNRVAEYFIEKKLPVEFTFAGPLDNDLSDFVKKNCRVLGGVGEQNRMRELFADHHVIILVSAFEGFPVVVKEGMSYGCVPVVTGLPGNKIHLTHLSNALLIDNMDNEDKVVLNAIQCIELLLADKELLKNLSKNAYEYVQKKFGKQDFLTTYRKLLID
ncbi:MAG: glycosyltransferase family 4 protein [Chitinophagaceae bacterium]|nr:glycosyltransferase family 4 protein [Chitinophagaceae bacterium]